MRIVFMVGIQLALGVLIASGALCQPAQWRSPIPVRNAEPLATLFLQATPAPASVLTEGQARMHISLDVVNHLLFDHAGNNRFEQDMEIQRLTATYSIGVGNGWEIVANASLVALNGGMLDGVINVWHRWFSLHGGGRANHRNYQVHERIVHEDRTLVNIDKPTIGLGDSTVEVRRWLGQHGRSFWAARAMLKLPTGNTSALFGSGAFDAALGLIVSYQSNPRLVWHGNLSKVWVGRPRHLSMPARDMMQWLLAVGYVLDSRTSLVVQVDSNRTPIVVGVPYGDGDRRSLTIGIVHDVGSYRILEVSITENQFGWLARIAPDFHLRIGFSWVTGGLKLP